ncbi:MAG: multidrug resistance efflux transporter family protein [Candidatus Methylopumilus sp.]|jgi:uncharacterized membrane protein YqjE
MWGTILKLIAMKFVGHRLHLVVMQLMAFTERRAQILSRNMGEEWHRLVKTMVGLIIILSSLAFSALIGAAWVVASAWQNPSRDLILGSALLIPLAIVLIIGFYVRSLWHNKPYLQHSRDQLDTDWQVLRNAFGEKAPATQPEFTASNINT